MKKLIFLAAFATITLGLYAQNQIYKVDFVDINYSKTDTFQIRFNIRDQEGNKRYPVIKNDSVKLQENKREIRNGIITSLGRGGS